MYIQYRTALRDVGEAHQFLCTVILTNIQFSQRPQDSPTVSDLVNYMLQVEIANTTRLGIYSGIMNGRITWQLCIHADGSFNHAV